MDARDELLAAWRERGRDLDRLSDLIYCPPGSRFTARYGLPPRVGCRGTTRDGRPCVAHAAIIGPTGYCHWHDPALGRERAAWCDGRRGSRALRWFCRVASLTGQPIPTQVGIHPDPPALLPALDLTGVPEGQRRAVAALLDCPNGRTYAEAAGALGVHGGTLRRHLARLRSGRPALYAAVMAQRETQLDARHAAAEARARGRRAKRRAAHRARYGCAPWER